MAYKAKSCIEQMTISIKDCDKYKQFNINLPAALHDPPPTVRDPFRNAPIQSAKNAKSLALNTVVWTVPHHAVSHQLYFLNARRTVPNAK
jgi:hypothetical protein